MATLKTAIISNSNGMELHVCNFGATIMSLKVPNKHGELTEVVVGLSSPLDYIKPEYLKQNICLGSSVGRYAGRISQKGFTIDDEFYPLFHQNEVHLHGGLKGFDKRYWHIEKVNRDENPSITLVYTSKHLEEGYPGKLEAKVTYQLTESNELKITYEAETDRTTHVNLTNHAYFNLNGKGSILEHQLMVQSDKYLEVDSETIPKGTILKTKNTRFDISELSKIDRPDFNGFDDAFILKGSSTNAILFSEDSGIKMEISTTQPAMVVFTPKRFQDLSLKKGSNYSEFPAICFETQNFPDAPNHSHFPSSLLRPGDHYLSESIFKFYIDQ